MQRELVLLDLLNRGSPERHIARTVARVGKRKSGDEHLAPRELSRPRLLADLH